jgi:hypothetical protein
MLVQGEPPLPPGLGERFRFLIEGLTFTGEKAKVEWRPV